MCSPGPGVHHAAASTACQKYGDMLPQSTQSAQRSFWKLIDEAPENVSSCLTLKLMSKPTAPQFDKSFEFR